MLEHKLDVNRLEETRTQLKFMPFEEVAWIPTGQHIIPAYVCLDSMGFYEVDCQGKKSFCWMGIVCHFSVTHYLILNYATYLIFSHNSLYLDESACIPISQVSVLRYANEMTCQKLQETCETVLVFEITIVASSFISRY